MTISPLILWIGDQVPTEVPGDVLRFDPDHEIPDADLIILSKESKSSWSEGQLDFLRETSAPIALYMEGLNEAEARLAVNSYPLFRMISAGAQWTEILQSAEKRKDLRERREATLSESSRRNRELELLTEKLEQVVAERTGVLEESTKEERDKLARERQLIRFLSDVATARDVEDLIRLLRRELRRFHRAQSLLIAVRGGDVSHYFCSQGDKVLRAEGFENLAGFDEKSLRQVLANRFSRPFNKLLTIPLDSQSLQLGFFGVEYSMLSAKELEEVTEVLQERSRATGMAVERLASEDQQRRFAIRWERTFDGLRDPIAVIDAEMQVLRGNRSFSENLQKKSCYEMFAGRATPCEGCPVGKTPDSPETLEGQVHIGRRVYRLRSWAVREEGAARISGRVTHYDDITESRELSLRMLQNEKMGAIGELAGHIAHELNNPLTGIRSLAQVLLSEYPEKTLQEDLGHIENAARRCQNIIRHLLEFTQGGQGQAVAVRLDEIVENTLPLLKTSLRRHRQEFHLNAGDTKIFADPQLLQQVVFNLLNNACQAMKDPGTLHVETKTVEVGKKSYVELTVADTGPGISPEVRDRLFEPFVTTKREGEGTGLGLSTSKAIVERFGGQISFESNPGEGTRFTLRFARKAGS